MSMIDYQEQLLVTKDNLDEAQALVGGIDLKQEIAQVVEEDGQAVVSAYAFTYEPGAQRGDLLVIHSRANRAGICFGGDSCWGDYDSEADILTLDDGVGKYHCDGSAMEPEEL